MQSLARMRKSICPGRSAAVVKILAGQGAALETKETRLNATDKESFFMSALPFFTGVVCDESAEFGRRDGLAGQD